MMISALRIATLFVMSLMLVQVAAPASAQTINVLILQQDGARFELSRSNPIQKAVLNAWSAELNSPTSKKLLKRRYGISGMDVYDETAVTSDFYNDRGRRRGDRELVKLARLVKRPAMDILVLYALKARAVTDPDTRVAMLILTMSYRALDVKSGRFLGGDNVDLDPNGVPMRGCATRLGNVGPDPVCVERFVARHGENLARDAASVTAMRLAALLGSAYQRSNLGGAAPKGGRPGGRPVDRREQSRCPSTPSTFVIVYQGYTQRQLKFIESSMAHWACALNLNVNNASLTNASYAYKTRLNLGLLFRNIRALNEQLGVDADPRTRGSNEILVRAVNLRQD
ncbi:MAG: hypothetical protein KDJ36_09670 [Hyphomicrobiaceae bacterium]|nr:hypothetical protein [Hyphomicrobiaceae bacterium]